MMDTVFGWLGRHPEIGTLGSRTDIEQVDLDVGVFLGDDVLASSYTIDRRFLDLAAQMGLSITISVYRTEAEKQSRRSARSSQ